MKRLAQIFQVIVFRFRNDLCFLRAAALTFNSVLSVVPVLAVMFGIAKGFGLERIFEQTLRQEFKDQEEVIKYLIGFGYTLLDQARGGLIAGIGVITLFYTVLKLLSTIEDSLNAMWGLQKSRPLGRKIIDFLALILLCPIFFVISSSLTVFLTTYIGMMKESNTLIGHMQPMIVQVLVVIPYVLSSALFTFLYMYMPNIRVRFSAALLAGVCAGIAYQVLQAWYIFIQIQVSKTGAIYGSFAALPLFLLWLYFSWLIFLIGAEIVVIYQERLWDPKMIAPFRKLNLFEKELAFLAITKAAVDAIINRQGAVSIEEIAQTLRMPERLVTELVQELVAVNILFRTENGVVPAQNPETLRIFDVVYAVDGENGLTTNGELPSVAAFQRHIEKARLIMRESKENTLIKEV